jgi:hypothetical protein
MRIDPTRFAEKMLGSVGAKAVTAKVVLSLGDLE